MVAKQKGAGRHSTLHDKYNKMEILAYVGEPEDVEILDVTLPLRLPPLAQRAISRIADRMLSQLVRLHPWFVQQTTEGELTEVASSVVEAETLTAVAVAHASTEQVRELRSARGMSALGLDLSDRQDHLLTFFRDRLELGVEENDRLISFVYGLPDFSASSRGELRTALISKSQTTLKGELGVRVRALVPMYRPPPPKPLNH
jgi:hypothetical protein